MVMRLYTTKNGQDVGNAIVNAWEHPDGRIAGESEQTAFMIAVDSPFMTVARSGTVTRLPKTHQGFGILINVLMCKIQGVRAIADEVSFGFCTQEEKEEI